MMKGTFIQMIKPETDSQQQDTHNDDIVRLGAHIQQHYN